MPSGRSSRGIRLEDGGEVGGPSLGSWNLVVVWWTHPSLGADVLYVSALKGQARSAK